MDKLTEDDRRQIEQIHSSWIEFEIAGASHNVMTLCADDIEICPVAFPLVAAIDHERAVVAVVFVHRLRRCAVLPSDLTTPKHIICYNVYRYN